MTPSKASEVLKRLVQYAHSPHCRPKQAWAKGQTEPFPCDCGAAVDKDQTLHQLHQAMIEIVGDDDYNIYTNFSGEDMRRGYNKCKAELRTAINEYFGVNTEGEE